MLYLRPYKRDDAETIIKAVILKGRIQVWKQFLTARQKK